METITVRVLPRTETRETRVKVSSNSRSLVVEMAWNYDHEGAQMAEHAIRTGYHVNPEQTLKFIRETATTWIYTLA